MTERPDAPRPGRVPRSLVRPLVRQLHAYVPGEQPKIPGLIKLNTNESPYPPSPHVLRAVRTAADGRLRLYPDPGADALRDQLAALHGCGREQVVVGNGSDELLALATRAFVEPAPAVSPRPRRTGSGAPPPSAGAGRASRASVQFFTPSYSLYPVLAGIHGAKANPVALGPDFSLPPLRALRRDGTWDFGAALTYVTTPNAPSGTGYATADLAALCRAQRGVVVLDEAYVDFADSHAMGLALASPNVLVARTFSKGYSLCFQRVGYMVGSPELVAALHKVRDSYNVNGLGQAAALATLEDLGYYRARHRRIIASRQRLHRELLGLGFAAWPSQTNFLLVRPPQWPARVWLERLRERKILVRWFSQPAVCDYLRITIGAETEVDALLQTCRALLRAPPRTAP